MQRRILGGLAAFAPALPLVRHAEMLNYSYAELGYVDSEIEVGNFDVDGDGFALRGSIAVNDTFSVFAGYESLEYDPNVDTTLMQVGGGGHWPLSGKLDLVGRIGFANAEVEVGRFDDDESGLLLGARLRAALAPDSFELEGGIDFLDLDVGEDTFLVGEARYFFMPQLERTRYTVQYAKDHSPFSRRWFKEHNIDPQSVRTHEDLLTLPLISGDDIRAHQPPVSEEFEFRSAALEEIFTIHETSGTSGTPKSFFLTWQD